MASAIPPSREVSQVPVNDERHRHQPIGSSPATRQRRAHEGVVLTGLIAPNTPIRRGIVQANATQPPRSRRLYITRTATR